MGMPPGWQTETATIPTPAALGNLAYFYRKPTAPQKATTHGRRNRQPIKPVQESAGPYNTARHNRHGHQPNHWAQRSRTVAYS